MNNKKINLTINPNRVVVLLPINEDNKILMQLRDFKVDIKAPGMWGIFGGGIEVGEDALFAARRELLEELNISPVNLIEISSEIKIHDLINVYSTAYSFFINIKLEDITLSEGIDMKFVSYEEICTGEIFSDKLNAKYPVVKTFYIEEIAKRSLNYWNKN
jgi:8-oxo-dGTP diphosphatase